MNKKYHESNAHLWSVPAGVYERIERNQDLLSFCNSGSWQHNNRNFYDNEQWKKQYGNKT